MRSLYGRLQPLAPRAAPRLLAQALTLALSLTALCALGAGCSSDEQDTAGPTDRDVVTHHDAYEPNADSSTADDAADDSNPGGRDSDDSDDDGSISDVERDSDDDPDTEDAPDDTEDVPDDTEDDDPDADESDADEDVADTDADESDADEDAADTDADDAEDEDIEPDTEDADEPDCPSGQELNACGGCEPLSDEVGGLCGACESGEWACDPDDPDALLCSGDSGLNACGGCQELPDAPGDNCTGCAWSPCVFYCDGQEGLSCGPEGFIRLPPGEFTMGSPQGRFGGGGSLEEQRVTNLTRAFYMQITPVTQRQWRSLMGNNPSCFQSSSPTWDFFDDGCDDTSNANPEAPVESVSWWEAASYANALSAAEGLEECYNLTCSGVPGVDLDCSEVSVNAPGGSPYECTGYRLPTEAEWEYAARGGTTEETYNGDLTSLDCEDATLPPIAWSSCNSDNHTHPVALKQPNQRGLYDILGNVREWVWDYFSGAYGRSATDPYGATTGSYRVLRGGSWWDATEDTRAGYRALAAPSNHEAIFGFRLVRTSPL